MPKERIFITVKTCSPNPWVIIGVLPLPHPPVKEQIDFFDA